MRYGSIFVNAPDIAVTFADRDCKSVMRLEDSSAVYGACESPENSCSVLIV